MTEDQPFDPNPETPEPQTTGPEPSAAPVTGPSETTLTAPRRRRLGPPAERSKPWLGIAVAGVAGFIVLAGASALGSEYSSNWASFTVGMAVLVAYLVEFVAGRVVQAACTTIVAAGIPIFVAFAITPIHTYNGFRIIVLITVALWVAVFAVGGTRGRAVFLALALLGAWTFAVLEAGHVQDTARVATTIVRPVLGSTLAGPPPDCVPYTFDDEGNEIENQACIEEYRSYDDPGRATDHSLGIALVSGLFAIGFLFGIRRFDGRGRSGLATAFPVPLFIAVTTTIVASGLKAESLWFGALLAIVGGLVLGAVGNGRRRFTTWVGAAVTAVGIALFSGDVATKWFDSESGLLLGITWLLAGVVAIAVTAKLARPETYDDHDDHTPVPNPA